MKKNKIIIETKPTVLRSRQQVKERMKNICNNLEPTHNFFTDENRV